MMIVGGANYIDVEYKSGSCLPINIVNNSHFYVGWVIEMGVFATEDVAEDVAEVINILQIIWWFGILSLIL